LPPRPDDGRPAALAVLAAAGLTQLIFPLGWHSLLSGSGVITAVLAARNTLLVLAAALSCWRITRSERVQPVQNLPEQLLVGYSSPVGRSGHPDEALVEEIG
jgi:hypothetical protein